VIGMTIIHLIIAEINMAPADDTVKGDRPAR
jgi:hypothetical protein